MTDAASTPDASYPSPVDALLSFGDARETMAEWPDYGQLGLGPEHIADLIRMATDPQLNRADEDNQAVWAPIHAWRALGQLRAAEAVEPLLSLHDTLEDKDWILQELPAVYGLIGSPAVPALSAYLADPEHDLWSRVAAANGLAKIGQRHPEARAAAIAAISSVLERHAEHDEALNGSLVSDLIDLMAVEAAPTIERAFADDDVDTMVAGDWEDVQIALGLLTERSTPRPSYNPLSRTSTRKRAAIISRSEMTRPLTFDDADEATLPAPGGATAGARDGRKAKAKRKIAAQSRRRNKKRK
jgi:uncharacterized protein DUF1186